jgi:hypothetical protein
VSERLTLSHAAELQLRTHAAPYRLKLKSGHIVRRVTNEFGTVPIRNVLPSMTAGVSTFEIRHPDGFEERAKGLAAVRKAIERRPVQTPAPDYDEVEQ